MAVDLEVRIASTNIKSDAEIAAAIKNALSWHSAVNEDLIEVKVDEGWGYLEGTVEWGYMKRTAEVAVSDIQSVRGVTNKIKVMAKAVEPAEVKRKINDAFHRSATVDAASVYVEVSGGEVILRGKVRTWMERQDAEQAAWTIPGVIAVDNKIEVDTSILVT